MIKEKYLQRKLYKHIWHEFSGFVLSLSAITHSWVEKIVSNFAWIYIIVSNEFSFPLFSLIEHVIINIYENVKFCVIQYFILTFYPWLMLIYNVCNRAHRVLKLTINLKRYVKCKFKNKNSFIIIISVLLNYNMCYAFQIKRMSNLKNGINNNLNTLVQILVTSLHNW